MFAFIYREGRRSDTMFVQESSSVHSSSCKRWWISNTKPRKKKLFNLFRYCCQTIAKLRQLFDAVVAVDPHYTWRFFVFSSQQFLMHIKDFSVCLIIIIMHIHKFFAGFSDTINVFGYCRFYYIAFRVSPAITLRWPSRNVASFLFDDALVVCTEHKLILHERKQFFFGGKVIIAISCNGNWNEVLLFLALPISPNKVLFNGGFVHAGFPLILLPNFYRLPLPNRSKKYNNFSSPTTKERIIARKS